MDLHPIRPVEFDQHLKPLTGNVIYLNGFTPNLTGRIRPGINYWSNWVEIH